MSAAQSDFPRWSNRKWFSTIFLVFLLQLALVVYLGERPSVPAPPPQFGTSIRLAVDPWTDKEWATAPALSDPTLFALPHPRSFSGAAWFTFTPVDYQFSDWTEPHRWLELDTNRLGGDFISLVEKQEPPALLVADKPMPALAGIEIFTAPQPVRTQSQLRLEGDLSDRPLLTPLELPSWAHADILTNSVVQLMVDAKGFAVSAVLLSTSGLKEADQFALKAATGAQFEPMATRPENKKEPLAFGRLVFEWHTMAPSAQPITNTAQVSP